MAKSRDIADSAAIINYIDGLTSDAQTQIDAKAVYPSQTGNAGKYLTTDGSSTSWAALSTDPTKATLTKTFAQDETATISLTSSVLAPVVSVTKEVPQTGVTNNNWDVNSTTENYTRLDSAYATTLSFVGFDVSTASFVDSFSVSGQETGPEGIAFNTDGTKMFIVGSVGDEVNEYTLSTGFDVSTATYSQNFSVAAQEINPTDIAFNTDGTKMFILGNTGDDVNEYTLSTGFDVSTATYSQNFSVAAQEIAPHGLAFNNDGTKMFVVGSVGDDVNEYTLSTGFDVSTATYSQNFSVAAQGTTPMGIAFNTNGTKMFIIDATGSDSVYEYTLSTGFDVSTATYSQSFSVGAQEDSSRGIAFNSNGTKMYVVGSSGKDVNEYDLTPASVALGTGSFASADVGKTIEANSGVFVLTATDGSYVETTAPTSYDQVASGSWEMYAVVYNTTDGDLEISNKSDKYSIQAASYDSVSFDFSSQETAVTGIAFNNDGTKLFATGRTGDDVNEYTLSTAYDPSTATYVRNFSVSSQEANPRGLLFSPDGTKMYVSGSSSQQVHKYNLTTGYDLSTASYSNSTLNTSNQDSWPSGMAWNADGTVIFVVGQTNDRVNGYSCPSAYDAAGGSHISNYTISQDTSPTDVAFNADGTKMFVSGLANDKVYEYSLSSAYTVNSSTASYVRDFSVATQENQPSGLIFNNDGSKMYIAGEQTNDIFQYSTVNVTAPSGYHAVHTTASTDTTYWTDINSMTADESAGDGNVYYAISTDDRTTWTVIDNTDGERDIVRNNAGTWQYNSNGTYASETWTNATTNTELNALQEAMTGASATVGYDLSNASFDNVTFSFSSQNTAPRGLAFNSNGTKMYQANYTGTIYQYTLSTGYDLSTASYSTSASFTTQSTSITNFAFSSNGAKLYILSYADKTVYQYSLSTAFDITTASYDSLSFSVNGQETDPYAIAISTDGTKFFVVGTSGDDVNEYTLSTAYNISTASFVNSFSTRPQEYNPYGIYFNSNGTYMFIVGNDDNVNQYTLQTGFDVSTASHTLTFSVASQEQTPNGIAFNSDGTKMFVSGYANDNVNQYSTSGTSYTNQMDKTQLDAVTDPNHIALGNDLDLAIVFNMTSGSTVPSSDGVAINYDANVLNKGAVIGTDYDFDAPAQDKVRITALANNNLKVRVV